MKPSPYTLAETGDGTRTLFCAEYEQTMHSDSGAYAEAVAVHVAPSRVLERSENPIRVLDVGFGLGYNVLALVVEARRRELASFLEITSLEKDPAFAPFLQSLSFDDERQGPFRSIVSALSSGFYGCDRWSLRIIMGDARRSISFLEDASYHAVFHDAFSPARNPELWTVDFFREVLKKTAPGAVVTTYSSALQVRAVLREARFHIGKGPSFGRKRESTLAARDCLPSCFDDEYLAALNTNIKATPYRDKHLVLDRDAILEGRRAEIRRKKNDQSMSSSS
jgi:tRNA U34 5-methylaminomethyl-2-thiouridine-forming methyltransferase MnmC